MDTRDADSKDRQSTDKTTPQPDSTDYGQPAGSPGGRGGATCYGGIRRVPPRTTTPEGSIPKTEK